METLPRSLEQIRIRGQTARLLKPRVKGRDTGRNAVLANWPPL